MKEETMKGKSKAANIQKSKHLEFLFQKKAKEEFDFQEVFLVASQ